MAGSRTDGRTNGQIRPLSCEQGLLNRADGSCRFAHGQTCVLVAIYGPADVRPNREKMDKATVEVTVRPKTGLAGYKEKALERFLRQSSESLLLTQLNPRTSITIVVQVIQDAGSLMSCSINGVTMACIDAGLAMNGILSAVSCAITEDGSVVLDPQLSEEASSKGVMTFAYESIEPDKLVTSHLEGLVSENELLASMQVSQKASHPLVAFMRLSTTRKLERQLL